MNKEFAELKNEHSLPGTTEKRKIEILKEMCDNLIRRNGGSNVFPDVLVIDENNFTIDELYKADGILNRLEAAQKMKDASDTARKSALEKNKYSPDSPYPPKGE